MMLFVIVSLSVSLVLMVVLLMLVDKASYRNYVRYVEKHQDKEGG